LQYAGWPIAVFGVIFSKETECGLVDTAKAIRKIHRLPEQLNAINGTISVVAKDGRLTRYRTPIGEYWTPPDSGITGAVYENQADRYGVTALQGQTVLDVGANIGTFSRRALAAGAAHIVAIEAAPDTAEALRRNLAEPAKAGKATIIEKAAWDSKGTISFEVGHGMGNTAVENAGEHRIPVETETIDALVSALGLRRVDLIKMDIEGSEPNALRGAAQTIRRFRPRLLVAVEHRPDDFTAIPALVNSIQKYPSITPGPCILQPMRHRVSPEFIRFE